VPRPSRPRPLRLVELAERNGLPAPSADAVITGVTAGTAFVRPGDLFAALPGRTVHGARYAAAAVNAGAVAVLTDAGGRAIVDEEVPARDLPVLEVPDVRAVLGAVSATVYDRPTDTLSVLGVTGTSGKTTTTYLLRAGLRAAGRRTGLVGTVATLLDDEEIKTGFTTPEAPELQALLAVMAEREVTDVAMEVSSHALAMGRADGIEFATAAFTNLSEDHLDFHADMEDYFAAKARMFEPGRSRAEVVVVDDEWGRRLAASLPNAVTVSTTGTPATWRADDVRARADGSTSFVVHGPNGSLPTSCAIPGRYNVANVVLALAMLHQHGVAWDVAAPAVAEAVVPGRMERVRAGQPFLAVVDYSHKPAAVAGALRALRPLTSGRLIVVLGCGGDRDRGKRPRMGELAARDADVLVVTDDNPRSEDPAAIRAAMLAGAREVPSAERAEVLEIGARADAIAAAVAAAGPGDTVLVAGKGHETGQEIAGQVLPFDDRAVLREAIQTRGAGARR
jgi:UDP-N-acetylmuramoyl-L-alanyl-D-glutamate--2,6-diaminopimelate ligase